MTIGRGECALIHTGGMLPEGADAVIMVENTQAVTRRQELSGKGGEIEVLRALAEGENTIGVGEDVATGQHSDCQRPADAPSRDRRGNGAGNHRFARSH